MSGGTRRPWRVFVRAIGPTYSFASEEHAHARARALVQPIGSEPWAEAYAEVLVYNVNAEAIERWAYRYGQAEPNFEVWSHDAQRLLVVEPGATTAQP